MNQAAYIFDVDGVLNDLKVYTPDPQIISHIANLLEAGSFVAINTGRGYTWVEENVIQAVQGKLSDTQSLERMFVSAEMGGIGVEFPAGTERKIPSAFSLTTEQIAEVHEVFNKHPEYIDIVHWYVKDSMATIDKNQDATMEVFRPVQRALTQELQTLFADKHIMVANSNDAIDVHLPEAGKWAGAELIYEWLRRTTDVQHDHFVCFGDSIVDYEMARFFAAQSHDTIFVFSGPNFTITSLDKNIQLIKTTQPYNEGVRQYLDAHLSEKRLRTSA